MYIEDWRFEMGNNTIELKGFDEILRKIDSIQKLEGLEAAMLAAGSHVKAKVSTYPPATEANDTNSQRWYERGYGPRWRRKDGSIGGRKTSEALGRKWTVATRYRGTEVIVGNNVSYGPSVQDRDHQAEFHKAHGWPTIQEIGQQEAPRVVDFIQDYLQKKFGMSRK